MIKNKNNKEAALAIVLLLLLIQWRFHFKIGLLGIAVFIILIMLSNNFAELCSKGWYGLAKILNSISTLILMFLLYFLIVFPTGIFVRLFKKSTIKMKSQKENSNFILLNKTYTEKDLTKPW